MKIAFVSYDFPEYCIRHVNEMAAEHDVLLMLPLNGSEDHLSLLDPAVRYEPFHRPRYRQPLRQVATMAKILRTVRRWRPDVVHFQNGHLYFNTVLSLFTKFPLVITIHDPRQHLGDRESNITPQKLMDYGFKQAHRVIVHGTDLKPIVVNELGFEGEKVHVIPHIAIGERPGEETKPATSYEDDGNTLLFFGRIWEYKGLDYLIKAEPKISAEFPNLRIVIGGQGEDFARYREMMVNPQRFEVHNGWISEDQRAQMFASASIVVLPYVEATQSGVIPVAYTYEKPVVATLTGGLPDMVDQGETGLLVPPRDSDALADAVIEILRDKDKRQAMGRAGKVKLERECSPEVVARQTMDVYQKTIHDRSASTVVRCKATSKKRDAAEQIHSYLTRRFVEDGALIGPDPGVRFNYRIWRFLKSYLPKDDWNDDLYYLQAQGYWITANWRMSQSDDDRYAQLAKAATQQVLKRQRHDGAWDYPNPEWKGRVATVEGIWASLGLMETFRRTGQAVYLQAAVRWHEFFSRQIGFQEFNGNIAVNYFAHTIDEPVPNNSALALRFLANLADATGDLAYLDKCDGLLHFIRQAQLPSGEVPYVYDDPKWVHFQCFQYQAFLFLDVLEYYRITGNQDAKDVLVKILNFLKSGISPQGFAYYQCGHHHRTVNYHTAAVAAALACGDELGVRGLANLANKAFNHVIAQQREDGSVPHSRGDYRLLSDRRAYPRYLAMMTFHLMSESNDSSHCSIDQRSQEILSQVAVEGTV